MKKRRHSRTTLSLAVVFFAAGFLVSAPDAAAQQQNPQQRRIPVNMMAENLLDLDIRTTTGEDVGEIRDVIFDRNGKIQQFIVDVGGFLGIGGKTVGVSIRELRFNPQDGYAVYQGTRNDLENKEEVDYYGYRYGRGYSPYRPLYGRYPQAYDPYYDSYWGQYPPRGYYGRDYRGEYGFDREAYRGDGRERPQDMRRGMGSQARRDPQRMQIEDGGHYYPQRRGEDGGYNLSMDSLMNTDVRTRRGENVGNVENLVVDRRGRITHAIIEVGGFLGIGAKQVAVPFHRLESLGPYFVIYPGTEEQLESMPEFDRGRQVGEARGWTGTMGTESGQAGNEAKQQGERTGEEGKQETGQMTGQTRQ